MTFAIAHSNFRLKMARHTGRSAGKLLLALASLVCAALSWSSYTSLTFVTGASPQTQHAGFRIAKPPRADAAAPGPWMLRAAAANEGTEANTDPSPVEEVLAGISVAFSLLSKAVVVGGLGLMVAGTMSLAQPASAAGPAWSHTDIPAWNKDYPMCTGKSQSPIDITTSKADTSNAKDSLAKHVTYMPVGSREIVHNSHVMQVNGNFGTFGLPDGKYEVKQFHFHFPAEHEINGKLGAGELHIVHQKQGAEGTDGLAVIGIVLEESKDATGSQGAFLSSLGFGTDLPQNGEKKAISQPVDLNSFADQLGGGFYHYSGSLTTPPCAEKVHWYVAKKSAPVTKEMIQTFKTRFPENGDNRPVQPVNSRGIVLNDVDLDGEFV